MGDIGEPGNAAERLRLERMMGEDDDFDEEGELGMMEHDVVDFDESVGVFASCEYAERPACCITNQINTSECLGKKGQKAEDCKYFSENR